MNDEQNEGFERFSLSEAAQELGVSIPSARRLVFKGKLQGFKVKKGDKERWEVLKAEVFRLKASEANAGEAFFQEEREVIAPEPSAKRSLNDSGNASKGSEAFIPLAAHLAALDLAKTQLEYLQRQAEDAKAQLDLSRRQAEDAQRVALQAERAKYSLEAQLSQYQRVLAESAESLAEERAMRLAAEAKALEVAAKESKAETLEETPSDLAPIVDTPTKRRGWGSRLKVWLLGEKAV